MPRSNAARRRAAKRRTPAANPRPGLRIAMCFILTAAILFVIAVFIGNYLNRMSDLPPEASGADDTSRTYQPPAGHFNKDAVPVTIGRAVAFEDPGETVVTDASTGEEETGRITRENWYDGASVNLRAPVQDAGDTTGSESPKVSSGMRVFFSSSAVPAHSYDGGNGPDVASTVGAIRKRYGYVSGVFSVCYPSQPAASRLIMREYELSLAAELMAGGFDDIILRGFGCGPGELEEAVQFIRDLKERAPESETSVGIALDFDFCESADARSRLNTIGFDCGFLAVDLTGEPVPLLMTSSEVIRDRVVRIKDIVTMFSMRVIVGCGAPADFDEEVYAARTGGALNVQALLSP